METYQEVFSSLLFSPIVGFVGSALLLLLLKFAIRKPELYQAPVPGKAPPWWIRGILVLTCTGVSFAHGSNDGPKGMGLIMLILIGILPGVFAVNLAQTPEGFRALDLKVEGSNPSPATNLNPLEIRHLSIRTSTAGGRAKCS